ncbi:gluconate 2-dehydrogenase subunit 3 family protein [Parapedobacter pyrenivorans]|uniref:gluconate 2-dehydrogenase subunit 3 family protein n=1 Tax=Parapedobacter pyrenivorans TaxID=1305674 RepID=UPI00333FCFE5
MNRRGAVRTLLYIAGGTLVLPACFRQSGAPSIALQKLSVSEAEEQLLAELAETLFPTTDTPGGKELMLHLFVLKMVDDCHGPEDQRAFSDGLSAFIQWSHGKLGHSFTHAAPNEQVALVEAMQTRADDDIAKFYAMFKRRAIQGYLNSQYVMTNLVKYELIPGRYNGYFPVEKD